MNNKTQRIIELLEIATQQNYSESLFSDETGLIAGIKDLLIKEIDKIKNIFMGNCEIYQA